MQTTDSFNQELTSAEEIANLKSQLEFLKEENNELKHQLKNVTSIIKNNSDLEEYMEFFDMSNDLILSFDEAGEILFANTAWVTTLNYPDWSDINLFDIVDTALVSAVREILSLLKLKGSFTNFRFDLISKDGYKVLLEGSISCQFKTDIDRYIYRAILKNVTSQVRIEKSQTIYTNIAKIQEGQISMRDFFHKFSLFVGDVMDLESFEILLLDENNSKEYYKLKQGFYFGEESLREKSTHLLPFNEKCIKQQRPMIMLDDIIKKVAKPLGIETENTPKVWIGIPLKLETKLIGMMVLQSFESSAKYSKKNLELLQYVSGQLTSFIVRNQNRQKLSSHAARLRAFFESGSFLMWSIDREYTLIRHNQNFAQKLFENFNTKVQNSMKMIPVFKEFNVGNQLFDFIDKYQRAFKGESTTFELKIPNKNGIHKWWEINLSPVIVQNKIVEVAGLGQDITYKKQSELLLKESEEKFRGIFESLQDVYFQTDMNGKFMIISPSIKELIGESHHKVIHKSISDYYFGKTEKKRIWKLLLSDQTVKNYHISLPVRSELKEIAIDFRLIKDDKGRPTGVDGLARDVTELTKAHKEAEKEKEKALRALEVKKQFLSNMSHEIRTPMNGIIGMVDILGYTSLNPEQRDYISTIKKSSTTLLTILNDILDLSKIEAGRMELSEKPISLKIILDNIHAMNLGNAQNKGIDFSYTMSNEVPEVFIGDDTRIFQIINNLTTNAIKFTDEGGVSINIKAKKKFHKRFIIIVEVKDTGIGIQQKDIEKLFKEFSQVEESYTKQNQGTGLGLAISLELSKLMGGDIWVESTFAKGSTFTFTMEVEATEGKIPQNVEDVDSNTLLKSFLRSPRIMVVDDNETNLKVAKTILDKAGCSVQTFQRGKDAIRVLEVKTFDVIFMDIQMPEMNGIEVTKTIHEKFPHFKTPIVAMTAFTLSEEKEEFLAAGMDDFLAKPIRPQQLIDKVLWILQKPEDGEEEVTMIETENETSNDESSALPIIQVEVANELKKYGGNEIIKMSYEEFEEETSGLIEEYKDAVRNKNITEAKSVLHTIKGTAGTLGVARLANQARLAEEKLKNDDISDLESQFQEAVYAFEEYKKNYIRILGL
ncbi:response regulator [Sediminitomix flava]|uniref:Sensory/regulatory protein RpfC n=1 Tax=Sediminitomix flava TaxID=379075 RepID=A0A315Z6F3_SEDFL|nr:response regulator [Sediminitomix flava]PWJ39953.1 hypothetical protein BC781_10516 [Sediminitomix flava]